MPRSKRDKQISLTKTSKTPGLVFKKRLEEDVRRSVEQFDTIYHFTYQNLNNDCLNQCRKNHWGDSRIYLSKNRVMQLGLGRTVKTEAAPKLHRLAKHLSGRSGLLFTNKPVEEVALWFRTHAQVCIAQPGEIVAKTVAFEAGPMHQLTFALEPLLRKLGMYTELKHGQINLMEDYVVCTKGEVIEVNDAKILKIFGLKVGTFRMHLKRVWKKKDGTCRKIDVKAVKY